jgi:hypothetical protein
MHRDLHKVAASLTAFAVLFYGNAALPNDSSGLREGGSSRTIGYEIDATPEFWIQAVGQTLAAVNPFQAERQAPFAQQAARRR